MASRGSGIEWRRPRFEGRLHDRAHTMLVPRAANVKSGFRPHAAVPRRLGNRDFEPMAVAMIPTGGPRPRTSCIERNRRMPFQAKRRKGPLDWGDLPLRLIERLSARQRPPSDGRETPRGRVQQSRPSSSPRLRALFRRPSRSGCSLRNLPLAIRRRMTFLPVSAVADRVFTQGDPPGLRRGCIGSRFRRSPGQSWPGDGAGGNEWRAAGPSL